MALSTSQLGKTILSLTLSVFLYYVVFCFIPFLRLSEDNWFYSFFPSLSYALVVPGVFGLFFLGGLIAFTLFQLRDESFSGQKAE